MAGAVPRVKLWVESDGRLVMSDYRIHLLEVIGETGSLSQAATALGLSYRRAWGKIKELEANLGVALVQSESGGPGGGHTSLSPEGTALVDAYRTFRARSEAAVAEAFEALLEPLIGPPPPGRTTAHG